MAKHCKFKDFLDNVDLQFDVLRNFKVEAHCNVPLLVAGLTGFLKR
jgi:hypothetical protein